MNNPRSILLLLLTAALLPACEENAVQEIAGPPAGGAAIKFFNFAPGSPGVNFYANDIKVTAVSTTACVTLTETNEVECTTTGSESTSGVTYGGSANGANGWYSDIAPGQYTVSGRIAAATDKNLAISNLQTNLADGARYSYYLSGPYNGVTKTADSFIVQDPIPAIDHSVAYVRFVNAVSNAAPMVLHATNTETNAQTAVGGDVAYKSAGAFTSLAPGTYDLATRTAGGATDLITRANVGFSAGRVYTITARGSITGTAALDNTANH
ncbi:MAG TPA: DUF4397 domain-containing protein [Longimicrobiales bacterium]|nr:DUF4397 domain-containing protein [Longimicrobiales bacterium]